jgi:hypothetical protein
MSRPGHLLALIPLLAGLSLGLGACALVEAGPKTTSAAEPLTAIASASPVEAVAVYVQGEGDAFAGNCEDTVSPRDIGKVCARFVEERDGTQAYLIGRTFSEFNTWVFVAQTSRGWNVGGSAPLDFHDMSGSIPWPN